MPNDVEVLGQVAPPSLSQGIVDYEQSLLNNEAWVQANPLHAEMLRRTLDEAIAATGYQSPLADARTPAQRLHDQQHGVSFGPSGEVTLPEHLTTSMQRDATGDAPDPELVAKQLVAAGLSPKEVIADAKFALEKTRRTMPVENLSAHALAQLALFGAHLRRAQATRPQ